MTLLFNDKEFRHQVPDIGMEPLENIITEDKIKFENTLKEITDKYNFLFPITFNKNIDYRKALALFIFELDKENKDKKLLTEITEEEKVKHEIINPERYNLNKKTWNKTVEEWHKNGKVKGGKRRYQYSYGKQRLSYKKRSKSDRKHSSRKHLKK